MPNNITINQSPSLIQGNKFKKFQRKIENNLEKRAKKVSSREGFTTINIDNMNLPSNSLASKTNEIVSQNSFSANQKQIMSDLRAQYQNALAEYQNLLSQINQTTNNYVSRTSSSNPYLGKNINIGGGIMYVTKQGIAKWYPSMDVFNSTAGFNNCPAQQQIMNIDLSWNNTYTSPGVTIPTTPPLITGTPMSTGQSCGYEGQNVFVNEILDNKDTNYVGCYADSSSSPLMSFIGGSPPPPTQIINGDFSQPQIASNSYQYINSTTKVLGWNFNACLLNSSSAWKYPLPYPNGTQCVSIQKTGTMSQVISLTAGSSYTLSFVACGRNCCDNSGESNPINIQLSNTDGSNTTVIYTFQPPINAWTNYTTPITVQTTQNYILSFIGTWTAGDRSSAIQNIMINSTSSASGSYTYEACQQAAINGGYQYFALQNVNTSSAKGFCAVSNSEPSATNLGISYTPTNQQILWQSNTSGQTGNSAILNISGSLSVLNSSGASVYSTPNSNAQPSNYYGCYADQSNRAMTGIVGNEAQSYDLASCQQAAKSAGAAYFGLQDSSSGTNAQCFTSNDFSQTTQYGKASNCTQINSSTDSWTFSGGGWSNAVYDTNNTNSNYYLIIVDGYMAICRGTGPTDNQGTIWQTETFDKLVSNSTYVSANGKYGQNWMPSGSTLAAGDFISSDNGDLVLMMQTDGNLTLSTFKNALNCQKMSDGKIGGGSGANALYNINSVGYPANMGLLAYIDQNSGITAYPSSNTQYSNNYTTFTGLNSSGNDILNTSFSNANVEQCQISCNNNAECAGFVMSSPSLGSTCYPKTVGMYPNSSGESDSDYTTYVRSLEPITPAPGISNIVNNITSALYQTFAPSTTNMPSYSLQNATATQQAQLTDLQNKLNSLSEQINNLTNNFSSGLQSANNQSETNVNSLGGYLQDLKSIKDKLIKNTDSNIDNILNDSDIVILQKNYNYLFWSILAAGLVLVSMNLARNG
jgi:hypothetical protein